MKYIDDHCSAISELKECAAEGMEKYAIDSKRIEEHFKKSFSGDDNSYLKRSHDILDNSGITKFPAVTINGIKMKGSLNVLLFLSSPNSSSMMSATPSCNPLQPATNTSPSNRVRYR